MRTHAGPLLAQRSLAALGGAEVGGGQGLAGVELVDVELVGVGLHLHRHGLVIAGQHAVDVELRAALQSFHGLAPVCRLSSAWGGV